MLVQSNRVGGDERVCQGPGESTLMEMTVLERDSRRVMAQIQPPLCFPPVQTSCPPEPRLTQLNTPLRWKHCICLEIIAQWKSITLEKISVVKINKLVVSMNSGQLVWTNGRSVDSGESATPGCLLSFTLAEVGLLEASWHVVYLMVAHSLFPLRDSLGDEMQREIMARWIWIEINCLQQIKDVSLNLGQPPVNLWAPFLSQTHLYQ